MQDTSRHQQVQEELRFRAEHLEALHRMVAILAQAGSFEEKASHILREIAGLAHADLATLRVPDKKLQGLHLVAAVGSANWERPPVLSFQQGLTGVAFQQGELVVANDYAAHPRAESSAVSQGTRSSVFLPVKSSGRTIGVINVLSREANYFTPERVSMLAAIGNGIGVLLDNTRLLEELRQRARELEILITTSSTLAQAGTFEEKASNVLEVLAHIAQADIVTFRVFDEKERGLRLVAQAGPATRQPPFILLPLESVSGLVFQQGELVVVNDYPSHPLALASSVGLGIKSAFSLPIKVSGRIAGLLNVLSKERNHFTPERIKLLTAIGEQLGTLLENARVSQQLQASMHEMDLVDEVACIVTTTLDIEAAYEKFAIAVKKLVDFDYIGINLINHEAGTYTIKYLSRGGMEGNGVGTTFPLERDSGTSLIVATPQTLIRKDIAAEVRFAGDEALLRAGLRSSIRVPLISRGLVIGTLALRSRRVGTYGAREKSILERLAAQIAPAIENAQLHKETRERVKELEVIGEVARIITSSLDIDEVFERFAEAVRKLISFDRITINVINPEQGTVTTAYVMGTDVPGKRRKNINPLAGTLAEEIVRTRSSLLIRSDDLDEWRRRFPGATPHLQAGLQSAVAVPLTSNGQVFGALYLVSTKPNAYDERDLNIAESIGNQIAGIVANAGLYEQRQRDQEVLAAQAVVLARVEELERSRQRIVAVQEGLRQEIANHLHGRVQGRLAILAARLQELTKGLKDPLAIPTLLDVIDNIGQVIRQDLSILSRQLYPSILSLGLVPAFQSLGNQFEAVLEVRVELDEELTRRERSNQHFIPELVSLAAYRIAEEALTNVVKHAKASRVTLQLSILSEGGLLLTVRDNGQGLDGQSVCRGMGIMAMQDYAGAVGGMCVITSAPGNGTEVRATFPLGVLKR